MNQFVQLPLSTLPLALGCFSDGSIAFAPAQKFKGFVDSYPNGISAIYDMEGFTLNGEQYEYNKRYIYKEDNILLSYLKQLEMTPPNLAPQGFPFNF